MKMHSARWVAPAIAAGVLWLALGRVASPDGREAPRVAEAEDIAVVRRDATVRAVERVSPSVVNISTERVIIVRERLFGGSDLLEEFFGDMAPRRRVRQSSLGSGVIIDPDGYVVTNAHVIARATSIRITLPPSRVAEAGPSAYEATLVNISPENDLALLKIGSGGPFPTARLGRSDEALVGETVIALGNPFGLESSVTRGVLSATGRSLEEGEHPRFRDFLQTDAAINPGNSGGPLANLAGEVIGINTAVHSQAHGIGFAIPITRCQTVLAELLDERELAGTWIGVDLEPAKPVITLVARESPAERAGLAARDEIVSVDGRACASSFDVKRRIVEKASGERLRLAIRRPVEPEASGSGNGAGAGALPASAAREMVVEVEVAPAPAPPGERVVRQRLGLRVKPMTPLRAEQKQLDVVTGVEIVRAEKSGPGERAGLQAGDVIMSVRLPIMIAEGRIVFSSPFDVRGLEELGQYVGQLKPGARMAVEVLRDGHRLVGEIELR